MRKPLHLVAWCLLLAGGVVGASFGLADDGWLTLDGLFGSDRLHTTDPDLVMWLPDGSGLLLRDDRGGVRGLFRHEVSSGTNVPIADWDRLLDELYGQRPDSVSPALSDVNSHPGSGDAPSLDPTGRRLVGVAAGDLYLLDLATGSVRFITETPARARFVAFGAHSLDIEIFAQVRTSDWNEFLKVREDVFLRIMDIVKESGTGFAFPSQTLYLGRDGGLDEAVARRAEQQVQSWREGNELPFPDFLEEQVARLDDTVDYPPAGSATRR